MSALEKGEVLIPKDVAGDTINERVAAARGAFRLLRVLDEAGGVVMYRPEGEGRYNYGEPKTATIEEVDRGFERPRDRCARDSDWCDGRICRERGIECPNADAA